MAYALDILRMSKSLETEPILISQLVRGNCLHMSGSLLEVIFSNGTPELAELDSVQQLLEGFESKKMMTQSLVFDRCILVDTLTGSLQKKWDVINFDQSTQGADEVMALIGLWKIEQQGIHERDLLIALGLLGKIESAIDSDDIATKLDRVDTELARYKVLIKDSVPPIIPAMLLPGTLKGLKQLAEVQAMKTVLQTAIAVQRYKLTEGHLPDDLGRLVPKYLPVIPVDPFVSKPLTYQVTESGYLLYSVGKDLQDNQGQRFNGNKENAYDLVFKVSAVK